MITHRRLLAFGFWVVSTQWATASEQVSKPMDEFRYLFSENLKGDVDYGDHSVDEYLLTPPIELLKEPDGVSPKEVMDSLKRVYRNYQASDLYVETKQRVLSSNSKLKKQKDRSIIMFVFPGIFGEFIDNRVFEKVFAAGGSAQGRYSSRLSRAKGSTFDLGKMEFVELPLSELVSIASLDSKDGEPETKLVYLKPRRGSLDSLGTLDSNVQSFLPRMDKVLKLMDFNPAREEIVLLGYSRGLMVALDLLVKARRDAKKFKWAGHIKGVVGLAGTFYGSELANEALYGKESSSFQGLRILEELSSSLSAPEAGDDRSWLEEAVYRSKNYLLWSGAIKRFTSLKVEQAALQSIDWAQEMTSIGKIKPNFMYFATMLYRIAFDLFSLHREFDRHFGNVNKFQLLVKKTFQGIKSLTTLSNSRWWKHLVLPDDVKIYSLTASMPDPIPTGRDELNVSSRKIFELPGFGRETIDYEWVLRGSFYDMIGATDVSLNDSQVTMYGSRYWNNLSNQLNEDQPTVEHHYLGALATHHWGCAFPFAFADFDESINPFPRAVLIKTISDYLHRTL